MFRLHTNCCSTICMHWLLSFVSSIQPISTAHRIGDENNSRTVTMKCSGDNKLRSTLSTDQPSLAWCKALFTFRCTRQWHDIPSMLFAWWVDQNQKSRMKSKRTTTITTRGAQKLPRRRWENAVNEEKTVIEPFGWPACAYQLFKFTLCMARWDRTIDKNNRSNNCRSVHSFSRHCSARPRHSSSQTMFAKHP